MKENIGKGTEIFSFMGEIFKLMSNYWIPENTENYFDDLIKASDDLLNKYKTCEFYPFAKGIILILNVYLADVKFKGIKGGTWQISFKAD